MKIKLSVDSYKGVDGSSLSATRCSQIVQIFEMLEEQGGKMTSYVGIQDEADKRKLFGKTGAKSAIRTFFPLLKKIKFVSYEGTFPANECFTELGRQFVLASRALEMISEDTPNAKEISMRLQRIKSDAQKQGLLNMRSDAEYESHNIWIALKLLKEFKVLHWNEFLYTLHCLDEGFSFDESVDKIKHNKIAIDDATFVNEKGEPLPNTCYSYLRGYLEEAGLIIKVSSLESKLTPESDKFYSLINL